MQFLTPIWLFALAAIGIPVVIHLWNIRPGKTLKVGSIALISASSKTSRRSFKLLDLLLLLLRCLLLSLLAFFLASPIWQSLKPAEKIKGWVLLPKEGLKETYNKFKPAVDSLTRAGYEFHYFAQAFLKADLNQTLTDTATSAGYSTIRPVNYWELVKELNTRVSPALPVYIFTTNSAKHFAGGKPRVNLNLHWRTCTAADSVSRWIAAASFTGSDAVKATIGNSSPAGTFFTGQIIQNGDNPSSDVKVGVQNGQAVVTLNKAPEPVIIDTAALNIAIYTDKYSTDAGYLNAALSAVINFTGRRATLKQYINPAQIPLKTNWLFWLSDSQVNNRLARCPHIFKYEGGSSQQVLSWIDGSGGRLSNMDKIIPLHRLIKSNDTAAMIWQDGFGSAVLSMQGKVYHFYSHFDPLWNDLVWNDAFPKMMLNLLSGEMPHVPPQYDKRILTNRQLQPDILKTGKVVTASKAVVQTDLSKFFWLALIVIFFAERWLAHKNKQAVYD